MAALRADQLEGQSHEAAKEEAQRHLSLADRYVAPWLRPLVLVFGGIAGTGKTTLAAAVADALGAELLRTDILRHKLFGGGSHSTEVDAGIYSAQARERVYEEMFRQAVELKADCISVALDGTFSTVEALHRAQKIGADSRSLFLAIECVCRSEIAHERICRRLAEGRDASDARPEIHDVQQMRWQPWPEGMPQIRVDTEQPLDKQVEQVIAALAEKHWPNASMPNVTAAQVNEPS